MDSHSATGQDITTMIIEHGRYKMKLDVRPVIGCQAAGNKTAGFSDIGSCRAIFPEQVPEACKCLVDLVIGLAAGA